MEDEILMQRAADGDMEAFRSLVERHKNGVYNYFMRSTGSVEDAEDLTQQCFVNLYRSLPRYTKKAAFTTFLYRIASNLAVSFSRKRKPPASLDALMEAGYDRPGPAARSGPAEMAEAMDLSRAYLRALEELPPEWRDIIELRAGKGLSYKEIAEIRGKSTGAVESILFRARSRLAEALEPYLERD